MKLENIVQSMPNQYIPIDPEIIISLPLSCEELRLKRGRLMPFTVVNKDKGDNNGYIEVPKNAAYVKFPEFNKHMHHIQYGPPIFLDEYGNEVNAKV